MTGGSRQLSAEEEETRIFVLNLTGLDVKRVRSGAGHQGFGKLFSRFSSAFTLEGNAVCSAAAYRGSSKPLKLLLDSGCEPSSYENGKRSMSAIFIAARAKEWGNVRLLIERGAKVETRLLHMAALNDEVETIELLLAQNLPSMSVETRFEPETRSPFLDRYGFMRGRKAYLHELWTPLHFAAWSGSLKVTAALLRHGAQVNKRTPLEEWTAVHLAIAGSHSREKSYQSSIAVIKILVENGADVNLTTKTGTSAYILAQSHLMRSWKDGKPLLDYLNSLGVVKTGYQAHEVSVPTLRH